MSKLIEKIEKKIHIAICILDDTDISIFSKMFEKYNILYEITKNENGYKVLKAEYNESNLLPIIYFNEKLRDISEYKGLEDKNRFEIFIGCKYSTDFNMIINKIHENLTGKDDYIENTILLGAIGNDMKPVFIGSNNNNEKEICCLIGYNSMWFPEIKFIEV